MNYLTYLPVWDKLEKNQQDALIAASHLTKIAPNEIIHNGSMDCTGVYLIISGQLRAYTVSDNGREITLYRLFPRDLCLFSASCMMKSIQFEIVISAEKETEALLIPTEDYKKNMDISAPLANYTSEIVASRFSDVMWLMEQIMWKSFDKRLAEFLVNESLLEDSHILKTTHETIGNHLGSPREVVTRMLKYFANENLVALSRGTIELLDINGLNEIINK